MKHFIEFKISGRMKCSMQECRLEAWVLPEIKNVIAYRFFDTDDEGKFGENYSGWHYFGKEFSFEEVKEFFSSEKELFERYRENFSKEELEKEKASLNRIEFFFNNMCRYGWERAVLATDGNWYYLLNEDTVQK